MTLRKTTRKGFLGKALAAGCGLMLLPAASGTLRSQPARSIPADDLPVKVKAAAGIVARSQ